MALFSAAIRRDCLFLLRFFFLRHVQFFSCEILLIFRLKYPNSWFSFHFYFLIIAVHLIIALFVLFLVAVISLSLLFFLMLSSSCIDVSTLSSMLASPLPFLIHIFCLYHLLGNKTLCIVQGFFFFFVLFCSPVHLLKSFLCPLRKWSRVSYNRDSPLMRFLLYSLVSSRVFFFVHLRFSFIFFFSTPLVWWCPLPIFPSICKFPFLLAFWFFLDLVIQFLP